MNKRTKTLQICNRCTAYSTYPLRTIRFFQIIQQNYLVLIKFDPDIIFT